MLCGGEGEGTIEFWEQEAFQNLNGGGEEGYGSVSRPQIGRLSRLWDRDNGGAFPYCGDIGVVVGEVVEVGEVGESEGAEVLQVVDGEAIRPSGTRAATVSDGLTYGVGCERGDVMIEGMVGDEVSDDAAVVTVWGVGDY